MMNIRICKFRRCKDPTFLESRLAWQFRIPSSDDIADRVIDSFKERALKSVSVPDNVWKALTNAISGVSNILDSAGVLVDESTGLLVEGVGWAKFGLKRLRHLSVVEKPPRTFLEEYKYIGLTGFSNFIEKQVLDAATIATGNPVFNKRTPEDIELIRKYPEIKQIVAAHTAASYFTFKQMQVLKFYEPAKMDYEGIKLKLNMIRDAQGGPEMDEYASTLRTISNLEKQMKKPGLDSATKTRLDEELTGAQLVATGYATRLSYDQIWSTPCTQITQFSPFHRPPKYQERYMTDDKRPKLVNLPKLFYKMPGYFSGLDSYSKLYKEEVLRQAYLRDETADFLGKRFSKLKASEEERDNVLNIISGEFSRIQAQSDFAVSSLDASFTVKPGSSITDLKGIDPIKPDLVIQPKPVATGLEAINDFN